MANGGRQSRATAPGSSGLQCSESGADTFIRRNQRSTDGLEIATNKKTKGAAILQNGLGENEKADDARKPEGCLPELQYIAKLS